MENIDDAFNQFIAGCVTGEGSFWITLQSQASNKFQPVCGFSIRVRKDDLELLRSIWKALGYVGNIHPIPTHRYRYAGDPIRRHDSVMLIIKSIKEVTGQVIPFFDRYELRGNKRRNYDLWKTAVTILEQGTHLAPKGLNQIIEIKSRLNKYLGQDELEQPDEPSKNGPAAQ